jgi:hypothetical protein
LLGGNWGVLFDARWARRTRHQLPDTSGLGAGARNGRPDNIEWTTTTTAGAAAPITPPLTPATNITVNGLPFFEDGGDVGGAPTIAWSAPRIGTPAFYTIDVNELYVDNQNRTASRRVASINTPELSFTFPPGVLSAGHSYVFTLSATSSTSAQAAIQLATSPFKSGIDLAHASVSSGVFGTVHGQHMATVTMVQGNLNFPIGLAVTGDAVYWTERWDSPWADPQVDSAMGQIWKANLDGSNPHVIATGQHTPVGIAIDGSNVYWTSYGLGSNGTVNKLDTTTDTITPLSTNEPGLGTGLLVVNGDLVWTSGLGTRVIRANSNAIETLAFDGGVNLACDGTDVYLTQYSTGPGNSGRVLSVPLAGGPVSVLAVDQAQAWDVATDGTYVYWSDQAWGQPFPATINRVAKTGGAPTTIATGQVVPESEIMKVFAIDSTNAYYVDTGKLMTVPLSGGPATLMAWLPNGGCPEGKMAVQAGSVYWTDTCANAVYRVTP